MKKNRNKVILTVVFLFAWYYVTGEFRLIETIVILLYWAWIVSGETPIENTKIREKRTPSSTK